jgi:hypothetical protein
VRASVNFKLARLDLLGLRNLYFIEPVTVAAASLLIFLPTLLLIERWAPSPLSSDEWIYLGMAGLKHVPLLYQIAPYEYRYRVLTPLLVRFMPVNQVLGYYCLTLLSLAIFVGLFWSLLVMLGFRRAERVAASALLITLTYPLVAWLRYPFVPDPLTLVFSVLLIRAAINGAWCEWTLWLSVGIVNEEKILFVVPSCLLLASVSGQKGSSFRLAAGTALSYLALCIVHVSLGEWSLPLARVLARDTFIAYRHPEIYFGMKRVWLSGLILSGVGPYALWVLSGLSEGARDQKLLLIGAIASVAGIIVVSSDIGRELGLLAIFWIPLVLTGLRQLGCSLIAFCGFCVTASLIQTLVPMFSISLGALANPLRVLALILAVAPAAYLVIKHHLASRLVGRAEPA